ncbi:MAG: trypsin-like peptidase domain-containing protein [Planctomycetales bacterium]
MKPMLQNLAAALLGGFAAVGLMKWRENSRSADPQTQALPNPSESSRKASEQARNRPQTPDDVVPARFPHPQNASPLATDDENLLPEEQVAVAVYERANRAVVNITTRSIRQDNFFLSETPQEGAGSGSVLDQSGHVLTNYHVVEGAREVVVTLFNGRSYDAEFVGADPVNDMAILKISASAEELFPIALGDSTRLKVGMKVFALGNPFGLERTLTSGIVSSLNRSLRIRHNRTVKSIIQTDAAVNPGNSGGPLLNTRGQLVGVNTAIASKTGQSAGVGFAIPASIIARVVPELIEFGRVKRAEIGVSRVYQTEHGLLIARLTRDGPAEQAGLRGPSLMRRGPFVYMDRSAADLIVAIDETPITSADEFLEYIESKQPGVQVTLTIIREGRRKSIQVTLGDGSD